MSRQAGEPSSPNSNQNYKTILCELLLSLPADLDLTNDIYDESSDPLGEGAYGEVFKARYRRHDDLDIAVAVKRFKLPGTHLAGKDDTSVKYLKAIVRELSVWCGLRHENILRFLGYTLRDGRPGMISPWATKGSIRSVMNSQPSVAMAYLAKGISFGLQYLHQQNIIHADLKCDNILLSDSDEPLLADFGISRCTTSAFVSQTVTFKGTARWMAIEFFDVKTLSDSECDNATVEHSKETDVWAFGMVLYELLSNLVPFHNLTIQTQIFCAIYRGFHPPRPESSPCKADDVEFLWSLCERCWKSDPNERPQMHALWTEIVGHFDSRRAPNGITNPPQPQDVVHPSPPTDATYTETEALGAQKNYAEPTNSPTVAILSKQRCDSWQVGHRGVGVAGSIYVFLFVCILFFYPFF